MSRMPSRPGESIIVKPTSNVYTVLVAVCIVVQVIGFVAMYVKHQDLFGAGLFSEKQQVGRTSAR